MGNQGGYCQSCVINNKALIFNEYGEVCTFE